MSQRFVLFPRGINVGKTNRVPMAELRAHLQAQGFTDVATLLASGNIIATHPEVMNSVDAADMLRGIMTEQFGVTVPVIAKTAEEFKAAVKSAPLAHAEHDGSRFLLTFFNCQPDPVSVKELLDHDFAPEAITIIGACAYVWAPNGVLASALNYRALEKALTVTATARNWNTITKIAAKL